MALQKFVVDEGIEVDNVRIAVSGNGEIDTSSGNLVLDSSGGTVAIDDALTVSGTASIASDLTVSGTASIATLTVTGDLTVSGTTTTINTETINLADNQIVLNSNATGSPTENAGLEIARGDSSNVALRWNETSDKWELTEDGSTYSDIATTGYVDAQAIASLDEIGDVSASAPSDGDTLVWNSTSGAWVSSALTLDGLSDVSAAAPQDGEFFQYSVASSAWKSHELVLDDAADVQLTAPSDGEALKYDASINKWVNGTIGSPTTTTVISSNSETTIASFDKTSAESAEFIVKVAQGDRRFSNKVMVLHNGSTVDFTDYAELSIPALEASPGGGETWVTRTTALVDGYIIDAGYGNGKWFAGGYSSSPNFMTSTDAVTWTTSTAWYNAFGGGGEPSVRAIAYANSTWVVGGMYGRVMSSSDGATWTSQTSNTSNLIRDIKYGGGQWVLSANGGDIRTSTDAVTWVTQDTSAFSGNTAMGLGYGNGQWVAVGYWGMICTSTDAVTWVSRTSYVTDSSFRQVAYGNGLWIATSDGTSIIDNHFRMSTDAVTWTTMTSMFPSNGEAPQPITYLNSIWLVGGHGGKLYTSTDGVSWVTRTSTLTQGMSAIAFGGDKFFVGGLGEIATSSVPTSSVSASVSFAADISGSDIRLRATIPDASTTSATVKVLTTTVGE